jgi:hypothetical protein
MSSYERVYSTRGKADAAGASRVGLVLRVKLDRVVAPARQTRRALAANGALVSGRRRRWRVVQVRAPAVALVRVLDAGHRVPHSLARIVSECQQPRKQGLGIQSSAECSARACYLQVWKTSCPQTHDRVCQPSRATSASTPRAASRPPQVHSGSCRSAGEVHRRTSGSHRPRMARCSR